ncbi:MAG: endonuclease III [Christensenellales bacterium]|jgi:endonuclease-3
MALADTQTRKDILKILETVYFGAQPGLNFKNEFQLLVATILSAQSTDVQVNKVTEKLFQIYQTPQDFAALSHEQLEPLIHSCGYYRAKSANIIAASRQLLEKHGGQVPGSMDALTALPGVGRKTANVVLSNAFGQDAIAVDTHVFRVSNRLGLAEAKNVLHTEQQLMQNIPKNKWSAAHHWLIWHGRRICLARKPKCGECPLSKLCSYAREQRSSS